MKPSRVLQIALLVGVVGFLLRPVLFPKKIPMLSLEVNTGGTQDLRDLDGRQLGLLLYATTMPGGQEKEVMNRDIATWKGLQESKKYRVVVAYGQDDADAAREFAKKYDTPVLIDAGKKLRDALGVKYMAIAVYREDGKILALQEDKYLLTPLTADDHVDALLE